MREILEEMTNNEILLEIKRMEIEHETIKNTLLTKYDELIEVEKRFDIANKILLQRLKKD